MTIKVSGLITNVITDTRAWTAAEVRAHYEKGIVMTPEEAHAAAVEDAAGDAYRAMVYGADASLATDMAAAVTRGTNAAIRAYRAAMERHGFVMVPVEATREMKDAACRLNHPRDEEIYRAMLAARPKVE